MIQMSTSTDLIMLLQRLPETGAGAYWRLLDEFPTLKTAFDAPLSLLSNVLSKPACEALMEFRDRGEASAIMRQVRADQIWLKNHDITLLDTHCEDYPRILSEIKRAPPLLYVWGDPSVLSLPQVAIVGSRSPSSSGKDNAFHFAKEMAAAGVTITSGLALGVDIAAHQGALSANGKTIAVLGTGIDQIYPQRHQQLARELVLAGGAVVTEFPLGVQPLPANFPQRNRIISGLSCGVLVVEAAIKSGSLITARYAVQQNREVFAIPGSIHNPLSRGCHALIKEGAKLVETAQDVIDEIQGFLAMKWRELEQAAPMAATFEVAKELVENEHEEIILKSLDYDPISFDTLVKRTALSAGELMAALLTMELKGTVGNMGSGYTKALTASSPKLSVRL
jgi:DNA processing protein